MTEEETRIVNEKRAKFYASLGLTKERLEEIQRHQSLVLKKENDAQKLKRKKIRERIINQSKHLRREANVNPDTRKGLLKLYLQLCSYSCTVVDSAYFNNFIFLCIIVAGADVGIQTYPGMTDNDVVNIIDFTILCAFSAEIVFKIMSEGVTPFVFFFGEDAYWNCFDFAVVALCMPFIPIPNGQVAVLRLFRLARLAKIFRRVPQVFNHSPSYVLQLFPYSSFLYFLSILSD